LGILTRDIRHKGEKLGGNPRPFHAARKGAVNADGQQRAQKGGPKRELKENSWIERNVEGCKGGRKGDLQQRKTWATRVSLVRRYWTTCGAVKVKTGRKGIKVEGRTGYLRGRSSENGTWGRITHE